MEKIKNFFASFIGQSAVIGYLNRLLHHKTLPGNESVFIKPLALVGPAGTGKTLLVSVIVDAFNSAVAAIKGTEMWQMVEVSSSITKAQFLDLWMNRIAGRKVIIFFDEGGTNSMRDRALVNLIKRLTETQGQVKEIRDSARGVEYQLLADLSRQFWIIATNEEVTDSALFGESGRFMTLNLALYNDEEKRKLIAHFASLSKLKMSDTVIEYLAGRVVGTGRAISELVQNEVRLSTDSNAVSLETAKTVVKEYGRYPMGLRAIDIKTLRYIGSDERGKQVQEISAHCAENQSLTTERIKMLAGLNFVRTHAGKKLLTPEGREYYISVAEAQKKAKAAKAPAKTAPAKADKVGTNDKADTGKVVKL